MRVVIVGTCDQGVIGALAQGGIECVFDAEEGCDVRADAVLLMNNTHDETIVERVRALVAANYEASQQPGAAITSDEIIQYEKLRLNTATYQASVADRALDLTYMEYELLRYFVTNPGKVFSRADLLSAVWGYEYFGGGRTVDVHVRRLRFKLGDEHAALISTVRSVGYIFGRQPAELG